MSPTDYRLMLPMVELTIFALGILLIDLMIPRGWKWINAAGAFAACCFRQCAYGKFSRHCRRGGLVRVL